MAANPPPNAFEKYGTATFVSQPTPMVCAQCGCSTMVPQGRATLTATKPSGQVEVKRIECVSYASGFEEPAEPIWRIVLNGYCADFPTETAAQNFAAQIAALSTQVQTVGGEGR